MSSIMHMNSMMNMMNSRMVMNQWGGQRPYHNGGHWRPNIQNHANLDGAVVNYRPRFWGGFRATQGFGIDLNQDGRYSRGQDGILAFDFNRNGKLSRREITRSRQMLRAFGGHQDLNGDGRVTRRERIRSRRYRRRMARLDLNRDGRLSTHELARGGARVGIDHNRDGRLGRGETYSPFNMGGRGRLNFVDPSRGYSQVNHGWQWSNPHPYCGCHSNSGHFGHFAHPGFQY